VQVQSQRSVWLSASGKKTGASNGGLRARSGAPYSLLQPRLHMYRESIWKVRSVIAVAKAEGNGMQAGAVDDDGFNRSRRRSKVQEKKQEVIQTHHQQR